MITEELCVLPDEESKSSEKEMKRRAKHVLRCKKAIWTRWTGEYMRALTERHNLDIKTSRVYKCRVSCVDCE